MCAACETASHTVDMEAKDERYSGKDESNISVEVE